MSEKDNMFVKEIFYNTGHSEIGYDLKTENGNEKSGFDNILNESLSECENENYIANPKRNFRNDYFYLYYDNEELGYYICWRVL